MANMVARSEAADCHAERPYSIGERLLRLVGLEPLETAPLEPAALEAVVAFHGLTSFIGMPIPTLLPRELATREAMDTPQMAPLPSPTFPPTLDEALRLPAGDGLSHLSLAEGRARMARGGGAGQRLQRLASAPP
jgi:hypothetical protein